MEIKKLNRELGNADLMLIDQILKNRFTKDMKILDAGCGEGRNLAFFVRNNYRLYGIDKSETAVRMARLYCKSLNADFMEENIQPFRIEENPFPDDFFDAAICINVLHSVTKQEEFFRLWNGLIRLVRNEGLLFVVMESTFGMEGTSGKTITGNDNPAEDPDRFYLTPGLLDEIMDNGGCTHIEPIKSLLIDQRMSQTYLLLKKQN